jgi:hypothetical protein
LMILLFLTTIMIVSVVRKRFDRYQKRSKYSRILESENIIHVRMNEMT